MLTAKKLLPGLIIVASLSLLSLSFDADTLDTDILFALRGSRAVSKDIAFIFIDSRDIQELGGWPITRDYYGYLTYILHQVGARTVGIDILLSTESKRYPEYDSDLSEFLRTAQNVCLPFAFADLSDTFVSEHQSYFLGTDAQFPIDAFRQNAVGLGFTNLPDETVLRHGFAAAAGDSLYLSFGLQCARLFLFGPTSQVQFEKNSILFKNDSAVYRLKTEDFYNLRLNHFCDKNAVNSMSLIDLFQTFQNDPEALDLQDKLVFVGVTAPGTAPLKVAPSMPSFPASLAHLTMADNLLQHNFVRTSPTLVSILFLALFARAAFFFFSGWKKIMLLFGGFFLYIVLAVFIFKWTAVALPILYPATALVLSSVSVFVLNYRHQRASKESLEQLYAQQIMVKERELQSARDQLDHISNETAQRHQEKQQEILRLEKQVRDLKTSESTIPQPTGKFAHIIHAPNSAMLRVLELVDKISSDDIPVLICGETGAGKEVISRAIHESGRRSKRQFIAVNCGALPETLLESELFGHERGAFTGATSQRKGRFELADGGTLFLDEITETSAAFQAKLLRVLQEGTFERLGSEKTQKVDVRIIAASSKNIQQQVEQELFREDLYYRLNGIQIELPALRQRPDDIPLLAAHFLQKHGYEKITAFSERALEVMTSYRWPGNVRELENSIRRAALLAQSDGRTMIQEIDLPEPIREQAREELQINYQTLDEQILATLRSLKFSHSSISQTAQALGNKDRGTITEYFRGLCFEFYVKSQFDADTAARALAGTDDISVLDKVKSKMHEYIGKIQEKPAKTVYKGLPKKYHAYLDDILKQSGSNEIDN